MATTEATQCADMELILSVATGRKARRQCKLCRVWFRGRSNSIFHTDICRYRYHNLVKAHGLNKIDGMLKELERLGHLPPKD